MEAARDVPDIGKVFDDHVAAEFVDMDLDATMATMTDEPYVNHVPVMTGGVGVDGVREFYGNHFIGKWPQDISITPVSRTVGDDQVVDELVLSFTHDIEMDQLGPGLAPGAGRPARSNRAPGHRRRAGRERARPQGSAAQRAHSDAHLVAPHRLQGARSRRGSRDRAGS